MFKPKMEKSRESTREPNFWRVGQFLAEKNNENGFRASTSQHKGRFALFRLKNRSFFWSPRFSSKIIFLDIFFSSNN